jgi:class 3 adenylate cyclase
MERSLLLGIHSTSNRFSFNRMPHSSPNHTESTDEANSSHNRQLEAARDELQRMYMIIAAAASTLDIQELSTLLLTTLRDLVPFDFAGMDLLNDDGDTFTYFTPEVYANDKTKELYLSVPTVHLHSDPPESLISTVFKERRTVFLRETVPEELPPYQKAHFEITPWKSLLMIPMESNGTIIGCAIFSGQQVFDLNEEKLRVIEGYVQGFTFGFVNARQFYQLKQVNAAMALQQRTLEEQAVEIEITNTALQEKNLIIELDRVLLARERERSERLLLSVLPAPIAERMKAGETRIAEHFSAVTVLFADVVEFTKLSARVNAQELVELLDSLFSALDALADRHGLEKIKTIGDAYMVVAGVPVPAENHCECVARFALEIQTVIDAVQLQWVMDGKELSASPVRMRVGIHTGEAVAGVIGTSKFSYDLWGDTVNTASRMESHGVAGRIHVTKQVCESLHDSFTFEERGEIEVKGKGLVRTWFLTGAKQPLQATPQSAV